MEKFHGSLYHWWIYILLGMLFGKINMSFFAVIQFCFVYFCGPIKSISKMPRKDVVDRPE